MVGTLIAPSTLTTRVGSRVVLVMHAYAPVGDKCCFVCRSQFDKHVLEMLLCMCQTPQRKFNTDVFRTSFNALLICCTARAVCGSTWTLFEAL
jgi:hypothetical protein